MGGQGADGEIYTEQYNVYCRETGEGRTDGADGLAGGRGEREGVLLIWFLFRFLTFSPPWTRFDCESRNSFQTRGGVAETQNGKTGK